MIDLSRMESGWRTDHQALDGKIESSDHRALAGFWSSTWLVGVLVAGLAVYLPALWGVFVFDDFPWILYNSGLEASAFDFGQRRPVTLLTFSANLYFAGPNPAAFHLVNIALHLANGVLVYCLIGRAIPHSKALPAIAALGAAFFLLHPAQTGAVSYISGRATSLMTFWLLIAHLAALRHLDKPSARWMVISLAGFVLAVGSKETALVYPAMWMAWLIFGQGLPLARSFRLTAPHALAAILLLAGMMIHPGYRALLAEAADAGRLAVTPVGQVEQRLGLGFCFNDDKPREDSCVGRRVEGIAGLTRFVFLPWEISIDPGRRTIGIMDLLTVLLVVIAGGYALSRRPGMGAAGAAWIMAALLPTSILLVRSDPVSDRLLYLPMVGVALVAAAMAAGSGKLTFSPAAKTCATMILISLAVLTWQRNLQYQSEMVLWQDAVSKNQNNPRTHVNLAYTHEIKGELDRAAEEYRAALGLQPGLRWAEQGLLRVELKRDGGRVP